MKVNSNLHNEKQLLERMAGGDGRALDQLHMLYRTRLIYYAMKFSMAMDEAEDIVAETFLKLWQVRTSFFSEEHMRNFLFLTTRNSALNLLNYKERQKTYLEKYGALQNALQENFSNERLETELLHLIYSGMEHLPLECRKIFQLYLNDYSPAEIADRLSISAATVRSQKRRAITLLKKWVEEVRLAGLGIFF